MKATGERWERRLWREERFSASGRGRQMPRSSVDAGRCRAPQQGLSEKWTIWEES